MFNENQLNPISHFENPEELVKALSTGDTSALDGMLKTVENPKVDRHSKITLYDAKTGDNYVTVTNEIASVNDKNEIKFNSVPVTDYLKISQPVADRLKQVS